MARTTTLKQKLREIRRKYKYVNNHRFFYNKKEDLKGQFNRIKCWFLIHDLEKGYSIFPIEFKRAQLMTVPVWTGLLSKDYVDGSSGYPSPGVYESIFKIFTQKILPAINVRSGNQWKFKTLIGWTAWADDFRQGRDTDTRTTGNKATKKRNANARDSGRRGQRNKKRKAN